MSQMKKSPVLNGYNVAEIKKCKTLLVGLSALRALASNAALQVMGRTRRVTRTVSRRPASKSACNEAAAFDALRCTT